MSKSGAPLKAVVRVLGTEEEVSIIYRSLKPETEEVPRYRSKVSLSVEGGSLTLTIVSSKVSSLRASLNTYSRILLALLEIQGVVGEGARLRDSPPE